jgi:hypothetical protein
MIDPLSGNSYESILKKISKELETNLIVSKRKDNNYYTITATSVKSITRVIEYFSKNPLLSIKYRDYKD